ncbi:hypothetical protein K502DRAFT_211266 [Neoconidiobolus thromboides FSU 785]|nr:hypothetical protein K502DRAFT_211266 [Neoconidiobolus thromboides FSU 785]
MDTETSQIQLHQQLDVPESVITNLTKKSKRDKDVNQLLVALESFFTENSLTKTKDEIKRLNEQIAQKDIDYEQEIQDYLTKLKSSEEEKKKVIKESKKTEKSLKDKGTILKKSIYHSNMYYQLKKTKV